MAMERIGALAGGHGRDVVAQLLRTDPRRYLSDARVEALGRGAGGRDLRRARLELHLRDVDDVLRHGYSFKAAFTLGITCSAINCIERRAGRGSSQSWHGEYSRPNGPTVSRKARICSTTLLTVPAITRRGVIVSAVMAESGSLW